MWLFTKHGFFSATMSTYEKGKFNVRSRSKRHLEALIEAHVLIIGNAEIVETTIADYRWRIMMTTGEWARLAEALAREVDYSNFKNECHRPEAGAADIGGELMQIWSIMNRYQGKHDPVGEDGFGLVDLYGGYQVEGYESWNDISREGKEQALVQAASLIDGPDGPDFIEPEPSPFDYSEIERDLQTAGARGVSVRPGEEGLPDCWQRGLAEWVTDPINVEQLSDEIYQVKYATDPLNAGLGDYAPERPRTRTSSAMGRPVEEITIEPPKAALTGEQAKIDALMAKEQAKTPGVPLRDRGPGDKPFKPDFHDQRDPQLGIIGKDGKPRTS